MPLTVPDQSIPSQIKVPDTLNTLSNINNLQLQQQRLRAGNLDYSIADQANQKRVALRDLAANAPMKSDGTIDRDAYAQKAFQIDPEQGASTAQGGFTNQSAGIQNKAADFKLHNDYSNVALQTAGGLLQDSRISDAEHYDPEKATQALGEGFNQMVAKGVPVNEALLAVSPFVNAVHQPGQVAQMLKNTVSGGLTPQGQVGAAQPTFVNNGQQQQNVNPFSPQGPIQNQVPVTQPLTASDGSTYLNGPQAPVSPSGMSATPGGMQIKPAQQAVMNGNQLDLLRQERAKETNPQNIAILDREIARAGGQQQPTQPPTYRTGLPTGQAASIGGTVDQINKHWSDTQQQASTAQQDIGVLQNIKQHAGDAITGVGANARSTIAGYTGWLAGKLGMTTGELEKTNTDLLAKNASMLALAGGDTNAARAMAEMATPNGHMTKEAIVQAADQVIAQRKLALARSSFLTPFKAMADQGHTEMYNNAVNQFNSVGDPKVIQFKSMTDDEKTAMKTSMTPDERLKFGQKLAKARKLGIAE